MTNDRDADRPRGRHTVERLSLLEDWQLEDRRHDLRGKTLHAADGRPLGRIRDMLVDTEQQRVAALRLEDGDTIDIDDVDLHDGRVVLTQAAPPPVDRRGERPLAGPAPALSARADEERLPIIEEEMAIERRMTALRNVRVHTRVIETPVHEAVTLQRERVEIERRPAERTLTAAEADALLRDAVVEVTERGEEAVVTKTARVVEEVVLTKGIERHTEQISDSVRRTEVDIDRDGKPGQAKRERGDDDRRR